MKYVGIQAQKRVNNFKSTLLLILFPCIILLLVWIFFQIIYGQFGDEYSNYDATNQANMMFVEALPWAIGICLVWFLIAYFANTAIINLSTGSRPLERRDNKRIYNLVENLCIANNMSMPKINIIDDDSLNAFASGINKKTFTVTLSRGIMNKLNDQELEGVIAHELTHIRNRDVKLLIVSIVFVGIFSFLTQMLLRSLLYGNRRSSSNNKGGGAVVVVVALILAVVGYLITIMMRFAISRKREYMADAGSAEMTKNPLALASALRKISTDSRIEAVTQKDVAQLFIDNPLKKGIAGLFSTHPPIEKRIKILEQF
ncbi:MAG: M48 family metallopeptidase [Prevotellaceae bacterium]|jgi:heat shock protein HtpX|nr:M48 family metallopeptidase [Prevotellaceae bacterium]